MEGINELLSGGLANLLLLPISFAYVYLAVFYILKLYKNGSDRVIKIFLTPVLIGLSCIILILFSAFFNQSYSVPLVNISGLNFNLTSFINLAGTIIYLLIIAFIIKFFLKQNLIKSILLSFLIYPIFIIGLISTIPLFLVCFSEVGGRAGCGDLYFIALIVIYICLFLVKYVKEKKSKTLLNNFPS